MDGMALVTGGGGFIGGHLVGALLKAGRRVRSVDCKPFSDWCQLHPDSENIQTDVSRLEEAERAAYGANEIYNLAADMGGMGFIETHKAECMLSVLINTHMLMAARKAEVERFFFSSSACVYAADKQISVDVEPLRECDAYPAMPEDGYGWEKLFSERMCRHFTEDYGLVTRIARFHNVYGPNGTFDGGREKAPAAICRKVISALLSSRREIEIWGDGEQTRSFMYIDDCIDGVGRIMASNVTFPLNLGSDELVSINQLVDIVEEIAGVKLHRRYKLDAPKGVRGRNSDNTLISEKLGWSPSIPLRVGIEKTYAWIYDQMKRRRRGEFVMPRLNVLGVGVDSLNMRRALETIEGWIANREQHFVCVTGIHGIMESYRDPEIRDIHNKAGLVTPDGMPLVWLLKRNGFNDAERVYGPDLMLAVFGSSLYKHFLYGSSPSTLTRLQTNLRTRFPSSIIVGTLSPPFRELSDSEKFEIADVINAANPDIVWVGLSTPKQEKWMYEFQSKLDAPVLIGVGAAFDIHAGTLRQAPKFIQRVGLEWAFRLAMEPRRLWRRYLTNNPAFVYLLLKEKFGMRTPDAAF